MALCRRISVLFYSINAAICFLQPATVSNSCSYAFLPHSNYTNFDFRSSVVLFRLLGNNSYRVCCRARDLEFWEAVGRVPFDQRKLRKFEPVIFVEWKASYLSILTDFKKSCFDVSLLTSMSVSTTTLRLKS